MSSITNNSEFKNTNLKQPFERFLKTDLNSEEILHTALTMRSNSINKIIIYLKNFGNKRKIRINIKMR